MKNDSAIHVVFFLLFSIQHTLVQRGAIVVPPLKSNIPLYQANCSKYMLFNGVL